MSTPSGNRLYYGDNLDVLRRYIADESVDLCYLDPPFNSNAAYNVLFAEQNGTRAAAQIKAFDDTWEWDDKTRAEYERIVENGGRVSDALRSFHTLLGPTNMLAYLTMMAPRLVELKRVLKPTGSIYLHCDPTASHYLKLLMDTVFGANSFENEVVWWYRKWSKSTTRFLRNHDVILFYSKSPKHYFHILRVPLSPSTLKRFGGKRQAFADEGRTRKVTGDEVSEGGFRPDVWDINLIAANSAERLGYQTQKPLALLEVILEASSQPGDVILDPFCGCGTAVAAAQKLGRRWIGIDITCLAVRVIEHRMQTAFNPPPEYRVIGLPTTAQDAAELATRNPLQFEYWAVGLVGARPAEKKGADRGIDGKLLFRLTGSDGRMGQVILSVKSGHLQAGYVRDLRGVIERERAEIGVLITLHPPTAKMRIEAAEAGYYQSPWGRHPRLQIITVGELLDGKRIDMPPLRQVDATFKRAPRIQPPPARTLPMPLSGQGNGATQSGMERDAA